MTGRVAAAQHERDRGAARAGARGLRLPHAALEDPRADRVRADRAPERDVRAVRELRVVLDRRADRRQVERVRARRGRRRGSRTAGCRSRRAGTRGRRPRRCRRARRPGSARERSRARPMSTRQVVGPRIVGRISPAAVWIENWSWSVQPARRRYMIASRAPLPDSSASDPSGLKMRSRATKPGASAGASSSTPSAPGPVWRIAESAHARRA